LRLSRVCAQSISSTNAEAVESVRAGNDMIIVPADLDGAFHGLLEAVKQRRITQRRIDESVVKILWMKSHFETATPYELSNGRQ